MRANKGNQEHSTGEREPRTSARERVAARRQMQKTPSASSVDRASRFSPSQPSPRSRAAVLLPARRARRSPRDSENQTGHVGHSQAMVGAFVLNEAIPSPIARAYAQNVRQRRQRGTEPTRTQPRSRSRPRPTVQVKPGIRIILRDWFRSGRIGSLLLFLLAIGGMMVLFAAPISTVQQITVMGNTMVSDETIAHLANIDQESIWFLDKAMVMQNIRQNAYIEQVRVDLALPNRVTIRVVERQPDVYWKQGPFSYLVDRNGHILEQGVVPQQADVLVIEDTTGVVRQPGDRVDPDALQLAHALAFRLPMDLQLTPKLIGWDFGIGVYILLEQGQTVVFGQYADLERKLRVLQFLLHSETPFTYLDLRPSTPFYQNQASQSAGANES